MNCYTCGRAMCFANMSGTWHCPYCIMQPKPAPIDPVQDERERIERGVMALSVPLYRRGALGETGLELPLVDRESVLRIVRGER